MSNIMSISRLRIATDGEGITTLVGFHGCPLNCRYCINPKCHSGFATKHNYTPKELVDIVGIDSPYFLMTGGGITFGGGEPLNESEFIHNVCGIADSKWKKNIETSLYSDWESIKLLVRDIDYWYIDIKEVNNEIYHRYTGEDNSVVLSNLKKLISLVGCERVCVRYPLIPDFNSEADRVKGIAFLHKNISSNMRIELFDYKTT